MDTIMRSAARGPLRHNLLSLFHALQPFIITQAPDDIMREQYDSLHQGKGAFKLPDGGEYIGEFKNGLKHGQGRETWPNGRTRYEGRYENGLPNGQGTFYCNDDRGRFLGEFRHGKRFSIGLYTEDGKAFKTVWCHDNRETYAANLCDETPLLNGVATVVHPNGDIYSGEVKNGVFHGRKREILTCGFLTAHRSRRTYSKRRMVQ